MLFYVMQGFSTRKPEVMLGKGHGRGRQFHVLPADRTIWIGGLLPGSLTNNKKLQGPRPTRRRWVHGVPGVEPHGEASHVSALQKEIVELREELAKAESEKDRQVALRDQEILELKRQLQALRADGKQKEGGKEGCLSLAEHKASQLHQAER
ncbi:unnamed protein product, partial [Symbiodinium pilosum]